MILSQACVCCIVTHLLTFFMIDETDATCWSVQYSSGTLICVDPAYSCVQQAVMVHAHAPAQDDRLLAMCG
jgi:hypothetical protein